MQTTAGLTHLFFFADLRMKGNTGMTTNSSTNEDEIEDLVEEGWKSKLSAWGLSAVGCAVWFRSRFVFPYI